ncbi:MAG: hypothetical protein R3C28_33035 [Pirellulaceae bacterium]
MLNRLRHPFIRRGHSLRWGEPRRMKETTSLVENKRPWDRILWRFRYKGEFADLPQREPGPTECNWLSLNHVTDYKSFVFEKVTWLEDSLSPAVEVRIVPHTTDYGFAPVVVRNPSEI